MLCSTFLSLGFCGANVDELALMLSKQPVAHTRHKRGTNATLDDRIVSWVECLLPQTPQSILNTLPSFPDPCVGSRPWIDRYTGTFCSPHRISTVNFGRFVIRKIGFMFATILWRRLIMLQHSNNKSVIYMYCTESFLIKVHDHIVESNELYGEFGHKSNSLLETNRERGIPKAN